MIYYKPFLLTVNVVIFATVTLPTSKKVGVVFEKPTVCIVEIEPKCCVKLKLAD